MHRFQPRRTTQAHPLKFGALNMDSEVNPTEQSYCNDIDEGSCEALDNLDDESIERVQIGRDSLEGDLADTNEEVNDDDDEGPIAENVNDDGSPGTEDLRTHKIETFETTITRVKPTSNAHISDTSSVTSNRSNLSALRRLRMSRSNFGQQVQDVVSKIDNLFNANNPAQFKSGSVIYHNRLSTLHQNQTENEQRDDHNNSIDSLSSKGLFDAIQSLQKIHRNPQNHSGGTQAQMAAFSSSEVTKTLPPLVEPSSRQAARRQKQISIIQEQAEDQDVGTSTHHKYTPGLHVEDLEPSVDESDDHLNPADKADHHDANDPNLIFGGDNEDQIEGDSSDMSG